MPTKAKTSHEQVFTFEPGRDAVSHRAPGLPPLAESEIRPPLTGRRDIWSADAAPAVAAGLTASRLEMVRPIGRGRDA